MNPGSFNESAQEAWDFARCQRPDGTYYGTGGTCRKGSQVADLEKRIARQERFLRTADPSKYSPKEIEIEKKELQRLKSQLAGMKSTTRNPVPSKAKLDREITSTIQAMKGAKGIEAVKLKQKLAELKAERREPGKAK